jgi:hypothetical protein
VSFPFRALALDLKIHPNTVIKQQHLIQERWLTSQPGVGTARRSCRKHAPEI